LSTKNVNSDDAIFGNATVSNTLNAKHGIFDTLALHGENIVDTMNHKYDILAKTIPNIPSITPDAKNPIFNDIMLSKGWSGYPDSKPDHSEISNDIGDFKSLMLVGNRSSDPKGARKVSMWDNVDVHGNLHVEKNMNVQQKLFFGDPTMSTIGNNSNNTDPYFFEKVTPGFDTSYLKLTINDDKESFQIWGGSCDDSKCIGPGSQKHIFDASGNAHHVGKLTVGDIGTDDYLFVDSYDNGPDKMAGSIKRSGRAAPSAVNQISTQNATYPNRNPQRPGCPDSSNLTAICPNKYYQVGMTNSCGVFYPICKKLE
jgi:hypothetical protein